MTKSKVICFVATRKPADARKFCDPGTTRSRLPREYSVRRVVGLRSMHLGMHSAMSEDAESGGRT
jgi:hypothetical protein